MRMWSEEAPNGKIAIPWAVEDKFTAEEGRDKIKKAESELN